ncbi:MAG TPA: ABC transporter permease [Kofleriaceae bacterium]|nr:ABC transporter permease [Kofleriaceae bacterium]
MFNLDRWREILDTLWRSKLRSLLTAFSVAWGIFMLVFLLGMGNGLQNGVQQEFADDATNSVWMFAGRTAVAHEGMPIGRRIMFANRDVAAIDRLPGVDKITGRFIIGNGRSAPVLTRVGNKVSPYDVRSVHPDHLYLENTIMVTGRFLNEVDIQDKRKVCAIGEPVARFLFGTTDGIVGRWIEINRIPFQVVGLFTDDGGEGEREKIYIPITTSQTAFNGADHVHQTMFTLGPDVTVDESKRVARAALESLAAAHHFSPDDTQAVRVRNNAEQFESFLQIFLGIRVFVVFMGICSLVAGVIGVSNIMMIVVRERTREIGVRKALGATPSHIVISIVQESVFITTLAGYLGLVAGIGSLALIDNLLPPTDMFAHPEVNMTVALGATLLLVLAGALAGLFPARAAARVNPIQALRDG